MSFKSEQMKLRGFLPLHLLESMNLLDRLWIEEIATHPVDGIRRVSDHPSLFQHIDDLPNQPHLWIFWIDRKDHESLSFYKSLSNSFNRTPFMNRLLK